jgi:hypothetical protein
MIVSLSEVQTKVRDAACGAGAPYGLAEDAGSCARRLAAWRWPWCEAVVHALDIFSRGECAAVLDGERPLCGPLVAQTLVDLVVAGGQSDADSVVVIAPLFVIPAAYDAGLARNVRIVPNADIEIIAGPDGIGVFHNDTIAEEIVDGNFGLLDLVDAAVSFSAWAGLGAQISISTAGLDEAAVATAASGVSVADASWDQLMDFVHKTYVPASEHSRLTGAGAGLIDSD